MKESRLDLRLTKPQKELIEQAAAISGRTVTDFSTDTLTKEAEEVIRRDRTLRVDSEAFDEFNRILDAPAKSLPGLADLLSRRSVFID
jgi:uncharacterized protein (DUF1778 family)